MPVEAVEILFEFENCDKSFKNPQGLAFYTKLCTVLFLKKIVKLQNRQ